MGSFLIIKEITIKGMIESTVLFNSSPEYDQNSLLHVFSGIILKALYFLSLEDGLIIEWKKMNPPRITTRPFTVSISISCFAISEINAIISV